MRKQLMSYSICWLMIVIIFNVFCFVAPDIVFYFDKYGNSFWTGYATGMGALIIHFIFMHMYMRKKGNGTVKNTLMVVSNIEVVVLVIVSAICMMTPKIYSWKSVLICVGALALSVIFTVSLYSVTSKTVRGYEALNDQTIMMRKISNKAESLSKKSRGTEKEQLAKKIYEATRFSNPVSDKKTNEIEEEILGRLNNGEVSVELLELVEKRNELVQDRTNNQFKL